MTESRSLHRGSAAALAAVVLAAVVLAGCGHTTRVGATGTLRVALREYRVTPQDVHAANGPLTIYIHNYGRLTHDLVITSADGKRDAASQPIAPGASGSLVATLAPGTYVMSSSIVNDQALGAYGTLQVG